MKKSNNNSRRQAKLQTKKRVQEQKLKRDGVHYKGHLISREKYNQIQKEIEANRQYHERNRQMFRRSGRMSIEELGFLGEVVDRMTPRMPYGMDRYRDNYIERGFEAAVTFDILGGNGPNYSVDRQLPSGAILEKKTTKGFRR